MDESYDAYAEAQAVQDANYAEYLEAEENKTKMAIKKVTAEMRKQLNAPLPPEAVKPHPTKTYLSSIKAIFVTERLNDVFGVGAWKLRCNEIERAEGGTVVIKAILEIDEYGVYYESYGGNDNGGENSKNFDLGDAYKGATTDAITKICSYMEIGIDVFKGKGNQPANNSPQQPKPQAEDNRPWLSDKAFEDAKTRMTAGEKGLYAKIDTAYRIKKEFRTQLKQLA